MAGSRWRKFVVVSSMLLLSGAVAEAQKGEGGGGDDLKVGGKGVGGQAQLSISGKVVDAKGKPLAGAEIEVAIEGVSETFFAVTKKKGKFNLLVPNEDAQYRAFARLEGYQQVNVEVAAISAGKVHVDITMELVQAPAEGPAKIHDEAADQELVESEMSEEQVAAITAYNDGVRAMKADDHETALTRFAEAVAIDPEFENALNAQAALTLEIKDYATAADALETLVRLHPEDLQTLQMAYVAFYMTGNAEGLAVTARRLAELDPPMVERDMIRNAKSCFDADRLAACRALMEAAVEARPDLAEAHFQLGMCCNAEGDSNCTKEEFTTFLELAPEHADAAMVSSLLEYLE